MAIQTKVKLCGITNLEDARFAAGAMVDYLGFLFVKTSPRYIEPNKAGAIINWVEGPKMVGVFMDEPVDDVNKTAREIGIDFVQLHGNEPPEYCSLIEKPIIKVIHISENVSREELKAKISLYSEIADHLLFDTQINGKLGGTGKSFDWDLLQDVSKEPPFFLAGGVTPENAPIIIEKIHPYALDVNSGVEKEPGIKNFDKVERLMSVLKS